MGGYGLYCHSIANALIRGGHDITILTSMHRSNRETAAKELNIHRELWFDPSSESPLLLQRNEGIVKRIIDSTNPDCILIWNTFGLGHAGIFSAVESKPTAVYLMLYDLAHFGPHLTGGIVLLAASQTIRFHFLAKGFRSDRIRLLTPGLNIPDSREHQESSTGIPLLFSGRIVMYKGLHTILEAMAGLPEEYTLRICGTADADSVSYERECRQWVRDQELESRVQFSGWIPSAAMPEIYNRHAVLVFPSIWEEPFGLSILEAMSYGTPVVASRLGGPAEIISDRRTGLLFEPGDVRDLMDKLQSLQDPVFRTVLGEAARSDFTKRFALSRFIHELETELSALVESSKAE